MNQLQNGNMGVGGHLNWQIIFIDDFTAYRVGQRNFCRWDQRIVTGVCFFFQRTSMEQIASKFRQLTRTVQRVPVNRYGT